MVNDIPEKDDKVIIIDCHSFPKYPLPYELSQAKERAEICIGTDEFHTPSFLKDGMEKAFKYYNYSVAINKPFSGAIVPMDYYQKDKRVQSIMIEIRRDLYMNEETGVKIDDFFKIKKLIETIIKKFV